MLQSTVITVTVVFISDHVNHRSKFCFAVNLTNNSTLNLLICLLLQRCIKRVQVLRWTGFNLWSELSVRGQCFCRGKFVQLKYQTLLLENYCCFSNLPDTKLEEVSWSILWFANRVDMNVSNISLIFLELYGH